MPYLPYTSHYHDYIDGLMQERRNSIANALDRPAQNWRFSIAKVILQEKLRRLRWRIYLFSYWTSNQSLKNCIDEELFDSISALHVWNCILTGYFSGLLTYQIFIYQTMLHLQNSVTFTCTFSPGTAF